MKKKFHKKCNKCLYNCKVNKKEEIYVCKLKHIIAQGE